MKNPLYYIIFHVVLAGLLLFNQVGLNFIHDRHDAHENQIKQSASAELHKHNNHCKVCSLETLFNLSLPPAEEFHFSNFQQTLLANTSCEEITLTLSHSRDRAPPVI